MGAVVALETLLAAPQTLWRAGRAATAAEGESTWHAQQDEQVASDSGDCLSFAFRDRKHLANPSLAALRLEQAGDAWHVRKCRGGRLPSCHFVLVTH